MEPTPAFTLSPRQSRPYAEYPSLLGLYSSKALLSPGADGKRHLKSQSAVLDSTANAKVLQIGHSLEAAIHIGHVGTEARVDLVPAAGLADRNRNMKVERRAMMP